MADNDYLPNQEAADYLGLSINTLNFWRHKGRGPRYVKLGTAVRYRRSDLDAFAAAGSVETSDTQVAAS